jgi:hypothetical protein
MEARTSAAKIGIRNVEIQQKLALRMSGIA